MSSKKNFGKGIVKTSARPLAIFIDKNGNEYVCDKKCNDRFDPSLLLRNRSVPNVQPIHLI
ncbi:hypothetical protein ACFL7D_03475 [candidate division KSB1 bacterium]